MSVIGRPLLVRRPIGHASGAVASFSDADSIPIKSLTAQIVPAQSGSGDPSPSNVRPISGWTGCNISHSGADTSDPTVIPVSWQTEAGTVYGGNLAIDTEGNVTLTVTHISKTFDGTESVGSLTSGTNGNRIGILLSQKPDYAVGNVLCNIGKTVNEQLNTASTWSVGECCLYTSTNISYYFRYIVPKSISTASDALSYLVENGCQIVFPLAEPLIYNLDPITPIQALKGENNLWADTGDVSVEYNKASMLYIGATGAAS